MANKYVTLTDSAGNVSKRFRFQLEQFSNIKRKSSSMVDTIGGSVDIAQGNTRTIVQGVIIVRHTEVDSQYGTLADLEYFHALNNPNPTSGSPSNIITYVDHSGVTKSIYFIGDLGENPMTPMVDGNQAWFQVPVQFVSIFQ